MLHVRDNRQKNVAGKQPFRLHNWNQGVNFPGPGRKRPAANAPSLGELSNETNAVVNGFGGSGD
jgi:hypothetical protein